jgi:hypothetical protein
MKICYSDESGHCGEKFNPSQPVEVLCGVTTDITKLFKTQKEHNDIIDILSAHGIEIKELKAAELHRGRKEWHGVKPEVRDAVYDALLGWSYARVCKFIICPIDSRKFFDRKSAGCAMAIKLQYPWEAGALNVTLAIQRENQSKKHNKGRTFVVFDEQKKHDERFLALFEGDLSFTDSFTGYIPRPRAKSSPRLDQIVDVPHFSKSHLTVLIQLADAGAYIVNRHISFTEFGATEEYKGERDKIGNWYSMIAQNCISHTSVDPPGKSEICEFYRSIRPGTWTAKTFRQ